MASDNGQGILKAVDDIVSMDRATVGYDSLLKAGLQEFAFEAVVLKYPTLFSAYARRNADQRIAEWKALDGR